MGAPRHGAAELFTWAARMQLLPGSWCWLQVLLTTGGPRCWEAASVETPLALCWDHAGPLCHPPSRVPWRGFATPTTPQGSLEPCLVGLMLARHALLICDEAFLPLVPEAEDQSMIALVAQHPNLV